MAVFYASLNSANFLAGELLPKLFLSLGAFVFVQIYINLSQTKSWAVFFLKMQPVTPYITHHRNLDEKMKEKLKHDIFFCIFVQRRIEWSNFGISTKHHSISCKQKFEKGFVNLVKYYHLCSNCVRVFSPTFHSSLLFLTQIYLLYFATLLTYQII